MKRGKIREEFVEYLKVYIPILLNDKVALDEMSTHLKNTHNVNKGELIGILGKVEVLVDQDLALLALIGEQISKNIPTVGNDLDLEEWFTEHEIKSFRNYVYEEDILDDKIEGDIVIQNVEDLGGGYFGAFLTREMIAKLRKHNRIEYDFKSQREARWVRVKDKEIPVVKIYHDNVREMVELIEKDELIRTALAYNCTFGSTKDPSGMDMYYNKETRELTITEGTQITYSDGTHRTQAFYEYYKKYGHIDGSVMVHFTNFDPAKARAYQVQLAKQTPISKDRIEIMDDSSLANDLVKRLNSNGELKNQIDESSESILKDGFIVRHIALKRGFEIYWKPKNPRDIHLTVLTFNEYMSHFFNYYYSKDEIFLKERTIYDEKLFLFHVYLAKKMKEIEMDYSEVGTILDKYKIEDNERLMDIRKRISTHKTSKRQFKDLADFIDELIMR